MNLELLTGRPTTDPDIYYTNEGEKQQTTAKFTLAAKRIYKREGQPEADFIPIVAFGRIAKIIEAHVKKGTHILIRGPLQNNNYTNKDGQKVYGFQVVAESVEFLEKKPATQGEPLVDTDGYADASNMVDVPFDENDSGNGEE